MPQKKTEEPLLEIRKYANRRYYDSTKSRHLSLDQIHKLILSGSNIRVVDAQTGQDITAKVLTQILLEYRAAQARHVFQRTADTGDSRQ